MNSKNKKPKGDNKFHLYIQTKYRTQYTPTKKDKVERELRKTKRKFEEE